MWNIAWTYGCASRDFCAAEVAAASYQLPPPLHRSTVAIANSPPDTYATTNLSHLNTRNNHTYLPTYIRTIYILYVYAMWLWWRFTLLYLYPCIHSHTHVHTLTLRFLANLFDLPNRPSTYYHLIALLFMIMPIDYVQAHFSFQK